MAWRSTLRRGTAVYRSFVHDRDVYSFGRWLALASLIGVVTGLGAVLLTWGIEGVASVLLHGGAGFTPPGHGFRFSTAWHPAERPWAFLIILPAAGLLVGWLVQRFAPEAEGHGTDAVIKAYHRNRAIVRTRVVPIKLLASILTIGSGGSAGREGPVAQIGAGFGSSLSQALGLSARDRRTLVIAGVAGGIGGMFRAPLGGALFAIEVMYSDNEFESEALIPALISSIISYVLNNTLTGWSVVFDTPPIRFTQPAQLVAYLALGVLLAIVAMIYIAVFYGVRDGLFRSLPVPEWTKPAIGGLGVALIALVMPHVLDGGYGWLQLTLDGQLGLVVLIFLVFAKILATSLTIGSGGSGGVFAPSLIIGGTTGAVFANVAQRLVPSIAPEPAACVLVGMGGFFSGAANVPIASLIMVAEMSGSYRLLAPMMLVGSVTFLLTRRISIYDQQVPRRIDSPAHLGELEVDILQRLTVREVMTPGAFQTVRPDTPVTALVDLLTTTTQQYFPVTEEDGTLRGIFSLDDLRAIVATPEIWPAIVAADIGASGEAIAWLRPDDDLHAAVRKFTVTKAGALPVLDDAPLGGKLLTMLTYQEVLAAYDQAVRDSGEAPAVQEAVAEAVLEEDDALYGAAWEKDGEA